jgi:hypothetical protein
MKAIFSSETSVDFQRATRRYTPEDSSFPNHRCENLKYYNILVDKCNYAGGFSTEARLWIAVDVATNTQTSKMLWR